jgi:hypothetical protein
MKKGSIFQAVSFAVNVFLIASVLLMLFGLVWEYSTRRYLAGFANAVVPYSDSPERKVAAILGWMENGPARETEDSEEDEVAEMRDPVDTLNYKDLLRVCGSGTNAFVNLASAGGIEARRLLLLNARGDNANHVVAEVRLGGRWVIVDPSFHVILKDSDGHLLTRQELARPEVLRDATWNLAGYDPSYNYEHTAFLHLARIPIAGRFLQSALDSFLSSQADRIDWTALVERQSNSTLIVGLLLVCVGLCLRRVILWYGLRAFQAVPIGPWEQLRQGGLLLFAAIPFPDSERSLRVD